MSAQNKHNAQESKDEDLRKLKEKYLPLMEAYLRLQNESQLMLYKKGDENAYYKALAEFARLVREAP